jgi:hypothetical protein
MSKAVTVAPASAIAAVNRPVPQAISRTLCPSAGASASSTARFSRASMICPPPVNRVAS